MRLLVAEKPSVAREYKDLLERVEGEKFAQRDGYFESRDTWISWCVGHLVGLAGPEKYGWKEWDLKDLPMLPSQWEFEILPHTKTQFQVLRELMKKAAFIINGGDAGREGELIYRLVVQEAGCQMKPQWRLWLNSMAPLDMERAWKNLTPGQAYDPLFAAALCRMKADWLVGMNGSRGYALGTKTRNISVGRVQTPTLALVVARDLEIENWKDRFFFQLMGQWRALRFLYVRDSESKFDGPEDLAKVKSECEGRSAELVHFEKNQRKLNPPKPFDLAELQKAANRAFGMKAADTLEVAQHLYEKKWISYPRTDSQYLPEGMRDEAWAIVAKVATIPEKGILRAPSEALAFFDATKVSDHYAIIPTGLGNNPESLDEKSRKIFNLIRSRFVLAFGKPYQFEEYKMALSCHGHRFQARATLEIDQGYKSILQEAKASEESADKSEPENHLKAPLAWRVGERDTLKNLEVAKGKATKPSHYTEATLLSAMETAGKHIEDEKLREAIREKHGLGTAATKASIIETLKSRDYINAQGKHLISTPKGRELINLVDAKIASPEMTGEWEFKLKQMEKGKYNDAGFMNEIVDYVKSLTPSYTSEKAGAFEDHMLAELLECPKCRKAKLKSNSYGLFCMDEKGCNLKIWAKVAGKKLSTKNLVDLVEKGKTSLIKGFVGKSEKKFDAILKLQDGKVVMDFGNAAAPATSPAAEKAPDGRNWGLCPKCGKTLLSGRYGQECPEWKACGFRISNPLAGRPLAESEIADLLQKRRTAVLEGFKSKAGNPFRAALTLNDQFEVKFEFSN